MIKEMKITRSEEALYIGRMLGNLVIEEDEQTVTFVTFNDDDIIIKDVVEDNNGKIFYCRPPKMS